MASLRDLRQSIQGIKNTQKITRAMKMVAAARLRRAQIDVQNARPYARKIMQFLTHLITDEDRQQNPFLTERPVKKELMVVVSADRGLCGAFNSNVVKQGEQLYQELKADKNAEIELYTIGKKGFDHFRKRGYTIDHHVVGLFGELDSLDANVITEDLIKRYIEGGFDRVHLVYTEFKSMINQEVRVEQYLPVPAIGGNTDMPNPDEYIYEPERQEIFNALIPRHLHAQVWRVLLESYAAELAARRTAMDNATSNADDIITDLTKKYNRERQSAITTEILEVVAGANALQAED